MADIKIENITKVYDNGFKAVSDFSLDIKDGEFIVLVGASGCGKSTTLRMIAGLEEITAGELSIGKKNITNLAPSLRDIAMVFQNYALYPQMSIYENLAFALKMRKVKVRTSDGKIVVKKINPDNIHNKVMQAAEMLGLKNQLNKKPKQLSGGQQQRVAVGRAMVREPKVFLFDEPLSNLDAKLRSEMRYEIKKLHQQLKATMIYVTHDQTEALTLADRIVVMNKGQILQIADPINLYKYPKNMFVAGFIGLPPMNFINSKINQSYSAEFEDFVYSPLEEVSKLLKDYCDKIVVLGIRPEHVFIGGKFKFVVSICENLGQFTLIHGYLGNIKFVCKIKGWYSYKSKEEIFIGFCDEHVHFFDKETTIAITGMPYNTENYREETCQ